MGAGPIIIDGPSQIIAIGDSLTAGSQPGITLYAPFEDIQIRKLLRTAYPFVLGEILSHRWGGTLVLNLGRSGSTSREWLPGGFWTKSGVKDFPLNGHPLDEIMESCQDIRLCLMMIGTNDANQSVVPDSVVRFIGGVTGYEDKGFLLTRENILASLIHLKKRGLITYLAKIPPNAYCGGLKYLGLDRLFFMTSRAQERLEGYTQAINDRIEDIIVTYPELVRRGPDFYNLLKGKKGIRLKDRLHLNSKGYRLMAHIWADHLCKDGIIIRQD
jgi:lysophospholipase L1-like esterase